MRIYFLQGRAGPQLGRQRAQPVLGEQQLAQAGQRAHPRGQLNQRVVRQAQGFQLAELADPGGQGGDAVAIEHEHLRGQEEGGRGRQVCIIPAC